MNPRASVTQANWIWPAGRALNVHFRGGREGGQKKGKPALCLLLVLRCPGRERGTVSRGGAGAGLPLCQEVLSLFGGRDIRSWGQCTGAQLELFVLLLHPMDLHAPLCVCMCVCVALFFHPVFFSNNPLQGYSDIICQASRQSSFLLWDYIREHRLYYHFRTY